jgi:hypothetical protein
MPLAAFAATVSSSATDDGKCDGSSHPESSGFGVWPDHWLSQAVAQLSSNPTAREAAAAFSAAYDAAVALGFDKQQAQTRADAAYALVAARAGLLPACECTTRAA